MPDVLRDRQRIAVAGLILTTRPFSSSSGGEAEGAVPSGCAGPVDVRHDGAVSGGQSGADAGHRRARWTALKSASGQGRKTSS